MNTKRKILCLALLLMLITGMPFMASMLGTQPVDKNMMAVQPGGGFKIAAVGDSALDAVAANANNLTPSGHGDDLLAGAYEQYTIVVNASDGDGFADIDFIWVRFISGAGANLSMITFTGATGLFTESVGATLIRLGAATNISAANVVDLTIPFAIEWAMGAQIDMDINITVWDGAQGDTELLNLNLDVIATLVCGTDLLLFTYAEYLNEVSFGTMTIGPWYYTGYAALYPLGAETDFYVARAAVVAESIGTATYVDSAYVDGTGISSFNNIVSPDVNQAVNVTYYFYPVIGGSGAAGTKLNATSYGDSCIVNPDAKPTSEQTPRVIGSDLFATPEGVMLIGGAAAVLLVGTYVAYNKSGSTRARRRTPKRRTSKRKARRRKR